jgi:hypothetical protein
MYAYSDPLRVSSRTNFKKAASDCTNDIFFSLPTHAYIESSLSQLIFSDLDANEQGRIRIVKRRKERELTGVQSDVQFVRSIREASEQNATSLSVFRVVGQIDRATSRVVQFGLQVDGSVATFQRQMC